MGLKTEIHFQRAHTMIVSHRLLWVILVLLLVMLCFSHHASAQNNFSFVIKIVSKQTSLSER